MVQKRILFVVVLAIYNVKKNAKGFCERSTPDLCKTHMEGLSEDIMVSECGKLLNKTYFYRYNKGFKGST